MQARWLARPALLAMVAAGAASFATSSMAQDLDEYRRFREARFAEVHKANPRMTEQVAEVKQGTAALLATTPARLDSVDSPPTFWRVPSTLPFVYDIPLAPRMVIVPAGEASLGSPAAEPGRPRTDTLRHRVRIAYAFAVSMFPVTFAEYALYAAETGHIAKGGCILPHSDDTVVARDWRNPGFAQTFRNPAVCIGSADAQAYADWLSGKTGHRYRLLSEAEYEYAARAGTATAFWWGNDRAAGCALTNLWDTDPAAANSLTLSPACRDGTRFTAELGSTKPNGFGLFDMAGNVASWTSDCQEIGLRGPARNGSPKPARRVCRLRVIKGASWATSDPRSAARREVPEGAIVADVGFRLARDL